jgi:pilus assembly protein CpaF
VELSLSRARCLRLEATRDLPLSRLIPLAAGLRADRLVVGELTGEEALACVEVMRGGIPTIAQVTANDALDALARIEQLCLSANLSMGLPTLRAMVAAAVDHVILCQRHPDGVRRVTEVVAIDNLEQGRYRMRVLYGYDREAGIFVRQERAFPLPATVSTKVKG